MQPDLSQLIHRNVPPTRASHWPIPGMFPSRVRPIGFDSPKRIHTLLRIRREHELEYSPPQGSPIGRSLEYSTHECVLLALSGRT